MSGAGQPEEVDGASPPREPRLCYLVWSYRDPVQVERLIRRLKRSDPTAAVLVRHDQFVSRLEPHRLIGLTGVEVLPRGVPVTWGDFSQVEAMLELFRRATRVDADWFALVSGDDYPIRPLKGLPGQLLTIGADALLEETRSHESPGRRPDQGRMRYRYQYVALPSALARPLLGTRLGRRLLRKLARLSWFVPALSVRPRVRGLSPLIGWRAPWHPFGGELEPERSRNWFAINRLALVRVLRRVEEDPALVRWYRRTFVPAEGLFAAVLRADPEVRVHDGDLHWEVWEGGGSPRILTMDDLPAAVASGAFFARKFSDAPVLDRLDAFLDADDGETAADVFGAPR